MIEERIVLRSETHSALLLPGRGGKVASFRHEARDFELFSQPKAGYPPLVPGQSFAEGDASGFDDVFPSMGEDPLPFDGREVPLWDHGEIWTRPMEARREGDAAVFRTRGGALPYCYEKAVSLRGDTLDLHWRIQNEGSAPLPLVWVCHALMKLTPDVRFRFPKGAREVLLTYPEPVREDLWHEALLPGDGGAMKLYFSRPVAAGICEAVYPSAGITARMTWDAAKLPWLGFWITNGGWRGDRNFAFEPAASYYDTVRCARANGALKVLQGGEEMAFGIGIRLRSEEE